VAIVTAISSKTEFIFSFFSDSPPTVVMSGAVDLAQSDFDISSVSALSGSYRNSSTLPSIMWFRVICWTVGSGFIIAADFSTDNRGLHAIFGSVVTKFHLYIKATIADSDCTAAQQNAKECILY
jgi:hypothetical protein